MRITAEGIAQLTALPKLMALNLSGTGPRQQLPSSVVDTLLQIPTLSNLELQCDWITDEGVRKLLELPYLLTLTLSKESHISQETIDLLKQKIKYVCEF
jgi:hypothetical protein